MIYKCYIPSPALQPYIEKYWLLSGFVYEKEIIKLVPNDGGINLLLNLGEDFNSIKFNKEINHERVYIVGTMTQTDEQVLLGKVLLFGIKFKPGAFSHFYKFDSLNVYANQFQELNFKYFPDIKKIIQDFIPYIDQFYLDKLSPPKYSLLNIISDISDYNGIIKTEKLAKTHFTTVRHLERQFNNQIGISPKEFINLTRFNKVLYRLQSNNSKTLSEIAWEMGYYDHAHLTNDFKRYTGDPPSAFILSDFSKSVSTDIR